MTRLKTTFARNIAICATERVTLKVFNNYSCFLLITGATTPCTGGYEIDFANKVLVESPAQSDLDAISLRNTEKKHSFVGSLDLERSRQHLVQDYVDVKRAIQAETHTVESFQISNLTLHLILQQTQPILSLIAFDNLSLQRPGFLLK